MSFAITPTTLDIINDPAASALVTLVCILTLFALLIQKEMVSGIGRRFARALSQALTPSISCLLIAFIWIIATRLQEVAP
jgi:hypothetical protein